MTTQDQPSRRGMFMKVEFYATVWWQLLLQSRSFDSFCRQSRAAGRAVTGVGFRSVVPVSFRKARPGSLVSGIPT
jgi:hypothetical protein